MVRYDASGAETARIAVPVSRPTCPAFGGAGLDPLYVTSARGGLDTEALRASPKPAACSRCKPGWRGLPESRFRAGAMKAATAACASTRWTTAPACR